MYIIFFLVAFCACVIGKICGMGGGVIIKPVLDAFGILSVSSINFLSGCTVIGMSCWSVARSAVQNESQIDLKVSTPLAIGAAAGGILGKTIYSAVAAGFPDPNTAGGVQAVLLLLATLATLVYTIRKDHSTSLHVKKPAFCLLIGLFLGMLGSFLGIGGGPFNMAVLFFFFSMSHFFNFYFILNRKVIIIHIHGSIHFQICFPFRLLQSIQQSSLHWSLLVICFK